VALSRVFRVGGALVLFGLVTALVPRWWCGRAGHAWFDDQPELRRELATEVAVIVERGVTAENFTNDAELFRHEWQFGTYQMGALGLLQVATTLPTRDAQRATYIAAAETALTRLLSEEVRAFDAKSWQEDALATLETTTRGHAAYLGYTNLVLGVHRRLVPMTRYAAQHDAISDALARRLTASPLRLVETYPREVYPVDNAAVIASVLLHRQITHREREPALTEALANYAAGGRWRDPKNGLLIQGVYVADGAPADHARASGTALAALFFAETEPALAREMYATLRRQVAGDVLGFGYMREYPEGGGSGDVDSGPVLLGASISGTGFSVLPVFVWVGS
jgi:hypothetical protein